MNRRYITNYKEKKEIIKRRVLGIIFIFLILCVIFFAVLNLIERKMRVKHETRKKYEEIVIPSKDEELVHEGLAAEGRAEWDKAVDFYKESLKINPNQPELLERIANIKNQFEEYPEALRAIKALIKLQPDNKAAYINLANIYQAMHEPMKALEAVKEAVKLDPDNIDYLKSQAIIANEVGNLALAEESYQKILSLFPLDAIARAELKKIQSQIEAAKTLPAWALGPLGQALAAEGRKEWDLAIRIYEKELAKKPNQPDIWKRLSDIQIFLKRYTKAAEALRKAIQYQPKNLELYIALSDVYAANKEPLKAFYTVECALKQDPSHIILLLKSAAFATQLKYYDIANETYQFVLCLKPNHKDALLGVAQLLVARNWLDEAIHAYHYYLFHYPDSKTVWIDLAKVRSWQGNMNASFKAMEVYRNLFGETQEYWTEKARLFAMADYPREALCILDSILCQHPEDFDNLFTRALAYHSNHEPCCALLGIEELCRRFPDKKQDIESLNKVVKKPIRSDINLNPFFYYDNQQVHVSGVLAYGQHFVNPNTSLRFGQKYENLRGQQGSGLETYDGYSSISDGSQWIGAVTRVSPLLEVGGLMGIGEIQRRKSYFLYEANMQVKPYDYLEIGFQQGRNLYSNLLDLQQSRTLYAVSPRSVSLGILQNYNRAVVTLRPTDRIYVVGIAEYDTFTDKNALQYFVVSPRSTVLNSQYLNVEMGMYNVWYGFIKRPDNGYFSPRRYRLFQATSAAVLKVNEDCNIILSGSLGRQQDETMPDFEFAGDITLKAVIGIFQDWQLTVTAVALARRSPGLLYKQYTFETILTRRF